MATLVKMIEVGILKPLKYKSQTISEVFLALSLMLFSCNKNDQIYAEFQKSQGYSLLCFIIKTNQREDNHIKK